MDYSQYLFSCLLKLFDSEFEQMEYDIQYDVAISEYEEFENSSYNDENRGEYECIVEYLTDKYKKKPL
jgi:hypothetical protein